MQVNTCTFRFTSSKNATKPPLPILKELAEFLQVQIRDKAWIEVPPGPPGELWALFLQISVSSSQR